MSYPARRAADAADVGQRVTHDGGVTHRHERDDEAAAKALLHPTATLVASGVDGRRPWSKGVTIICGLASPPPREALGGAVLNFDIRWWTDRVPDR